MNVYQPVVLRTIMLGLLFVSQPRCINAQSPATEGTERYYVVVFSYQDALARPRLCHTWATFAKVTTLEHGSSIVAARTISWLPDHFAQTLHITIRPSGGHNYTLAETLRFAARQCLPVCHWGPYEIDACRYQQVMRQIAFIESGFVRYKMIEPLRRLAAYQLRGGALQCTHAVTDAVGFVPTGTTRGYAAGALVASLFVNGSRGPDWLYPTLLAGD